jgi:hypothetical protein
LTGDATPFSSIVISCGFAFSLLSTLNSRSGVCPIISTAFETSVTPGRSTINLSSPALENPPSCTAITGSDTPKIFTRRSITSRRAFIESLISPLATFETSA